MSVYKKIKEFTEICPVSNNIGEYLNDACKVCEIYYKMLGIDSIDNYEIIIKKEEELEQLIKEILIKWEK